MKSKSKLLSFLIGWIIFTGVFNGVQADVKDFPNKPINLYVGWGAGGSTSIMARIVSQRAGEIFGQPVVIINKPGAGGTICSDFVRRSKPDGYTISVATSGTHVQSLLTLKVPYTIDDFEYIGKFATMPYFLFVNSQSPWKTLDDLIDYAKKHPGELKYASAGTGSGHHISMELFSHEANIKVVHVPMKSGPEVISAILGNHCQMGCDGLPTLKPLLEGGRFRFLAAYSKKRLDEFPNLPTFTEKGYSSVVFSSWYGIGAPKGIPKEVSDILKDGFGKALQDKEVHKMLEGIGVIPDYLSADDFTQFIHLEYKRLYEIIKRMGLLVQQ